MSPCLKETSAAAWQQCDVLLQLLKALRVEAVGISLEATGAHFNNYISPPHVDSGQASMYVPTKKQKHVHRVSPQTHSEAH